MAENVTSLHPSPPSLSSLRKELNPQDRKILAASMDHIEREAIELWPQLSQAIATAKAGGSFSSTMNAKVDKWGVVKVSVAARVRQPRPALQLEDMHISDQGALAFGPPPEFKDEGGGDAGNGFQD